jgi:hypothetical protein
MYFDIGGKFLAFPSFSFIFIFSFLIFTAPFPFSSLSLPPSNIPISPSLLLSLTPHTRTFTFLLFYYAIRSFEASLLISLSFDLLFIRLDWADEVIF